MHLRGRPLGAHRHICAFFHSKEEQRRQLIDFLREGIEQGDRITQIVADDEVDEHRAWLRAAGLEAHPAATDGQLKLVTWEETYLQDGCFDQYRQLKQLEHELAAARQEGFARTRLVANMEWALEDKAGVDDIVEYESRLNDLLPHHPDAVICTYDVSRFNAGVAMDVLRTHPAVLLGGALLDNPLYVPPEEFLTELRERRTEMASL